MSPAVLPTIFHITHPKAGSQWVMQVLRECMPDRFIAPLPQAAHFIDKTIQPGMFYPTVYLNRKKFYAVISPKRLHQKNQPKFSSFRLRYLPNWVRFEQQGYPVKTFVVMRDLRDTMVSLYFSLKVSHRIINDRMAGHRETLENLSEEDGLLYLMEGPIKKYSRIQTSWLKEKTLIVKYEDLLADELGNFQRIVDHCGLSVSPKNLSNIVQRNSFQAMSGRKQGEEDVFSHHRKGIAGDWRNHFTPKVTEMFKLLFGQVLIKTGYEKDMDW